MNNVLHQRSGYDSDSGVDSEVDPQENAIMVWVNGNGRADNAITNYSRKMMDDQIAFENWAQMKSESGDNGPPFTSKDHWPEKRRRMIEFLEEYTKNGKEKGWKPENVEKNTVKEVGICMPVVQTIRESVQTASSSEERVKNNKNVMNLLKGLHNGYVEFDEQKDYEEWQRRIRFSNIWCRLRREDTLFRRKHAVNVATVKNEKLEKKKHEGAENVVQRPRKRLVPQDRQAEIEKKISDEEINKKNKQRKYNWKRDENLRRLKFLN